MQFGEILQQARGKMSRLEAGRKLLISHRTVEAYERGQVPPPDVVVRMAEVYGRPDLPQLYCRYMCSIGQQLAYTPLNNVDLHPAAILHKLNQEKHEVDAIFDRICDLVINKRTRQDFSETELRELSKCVQELLDLEHVIEEFKRVIARWLDVPEQVRKHNDKCLQRGYVRTKPSAVAGAV